MKDHSNIRIKWNGKNKIDRMCTQTIRLLVAYKHRPTQTGGVE